MSRNTGTSMLDLAQARSRTKAEQESEVERVYRVLKSRLIEARLAPGNFLSEIELAAQCKTSRTPIREAFSRLAQDGWLRRIPRKGYLVVPISIREIVELYEYRKILECFAAEKVAQSASDAQLEELSAMVRFENQPEAKLSEVLRANTSFHLRLAEISANQRVANQLALVLCYVRRLDTICTQKVPGWIGHEEILDALRAHQPTAAQQAMARHIGRSRDKMLRLFGA
ncbi:MAG: GntR family transcriptional regulator [Terriglobia bacterium]